ncbi:MAG TPA: sigma 54-interacting transcriptional regulator [Thermoanaerobaculia bacterium]|nr:sigma 54-interacting transcriptional regulator [Thermoanaerobaculia bacterium]
MTTADEVPSHRQPQVPLPARFQVRAVLKETPATAVYRVYDACAKRDAAIKILRHEVAEPQGVVRFKAEFATLASLEHPNIVRVYDFGLLQDRFPYFTMEYFAGRKISEFFDGQNWDALYEVILQIAAALHHIHHAGIIHLDLKPSNILVSEDGRAKLMDFGVAVESCQVFDRQIRGTLQYMAPEVLRQDRVDSRADLYALGMTMYEAVTGTLPGYGRPTIEVIRMHLDEEIKPPSAINPRVPAPLERVISRLLEKDPRDRYPTAAALLEDVSRMAGRGVTAGELLVGSGELYAAPLIGRKKELDELTALVAEAREGRGNGVVIAGGEGMGKSRIVRDACLRAQLDGGRVFHGRCPINRKTIYAPFFEIFEQLVTAVNPDADAAAAIRRILKPVITGSAHGAAPQRHGQKYRLFNRIVQSMQDIYGFLSAESDSSGSPLILVVEDLQWADLSTAELFSFLVSEARRNKLLVIGTLTYQTGTEPMDSPSPWAAWEERAREHDFPLIRVEPLSEPLVREHLEALLGDRNVPDDFVRWMLWESSGSPLNIRRIVDHLVASGLLLWNGSGWIAEMDRIHAHRIPAGAASLPMQTVDTLPASLRGLVETAAVFGDVAPLDFLVRVAPWGPEETYESVSVLAGLDLLDESADGKTVTFPQIQLREAVYNAMSERRRCELHLAVGEVLERALAAGSTHLVGQVAYHFGRAGDTERGVRYSIEAGDLALRTLAYEEATEFYRAALEMMDLGGVEEARKAEVREKLADAYYCRADYRGAMHSYQFLLKSIQSRTPDDEPSSDIARVMTKIGKVLGKRGDQDSALAYLQNALAIYEQLCRTGEVAELLNRMAWLHRDKSDFDAARECVERATPILEAMPLSAVHGYVRNMLGVIEYSVGNWAAARALLLEAIDIGERVGSEQLTKVASTNLGNTMWKLGEWQPALQHFRRNLEISEAEGDLWDLVGAYNNAGVVEYGLGNFAAAAGLFERSVRINEKIGAVESEAMARENLGDALEMLGRWPEAIHQYQRCVSLDGFDEGRSSRSSVLVPMARLAKKRGDIAMALEYGQKALAAAERARDHDLVAEACYALAAIEDERDNVAESEAYLSRALVIFEENRTLQGLARAHTAAACLALRQQQLERAVEHAETGGRLARQLGDRYTMAKSDWAWARIHAFKGEREAAAARFDEARAALEALDTPYELARLLFDSGVHRDEAEEATQTIRSAIRIFERLDAVHDLERARGALFRIRPSGKPPDQHVVGLYEIVKIINSTLSVEEVLNRVLDLAVKRLRAERGMIMLLDPITGALRTRVARNIHDESDARRSPQSIVKEVIQSAQSVISADAAQDHRFLAFESVVAENILSILCVPLAMKDRIAGAIYVDHRQVRHLFSQRDLSFLEAFADQAAIAIENARLYEELEEARLRLSLENETLRREVLSNRHLESLVGQSNAVSGIQLAIRKAAAGSSTVLLRGESGTGKGLVARIIHNIGPRRNGPFIKFNCAALPETLAESELFGHERGAFTGADRRKLGRFELANGGTIFLDEIGKISLAMQAKLLRVVEDKEFERVGGTQTIKTDVKIIAATNLDLEKAIANGTFREDLYYRLNIVPLLLPALRERKDDIPILAEHFIRKICHDLGVEAKRLEHGVLDLFLRHHWPGNVRELEATLHRAIVMANGSTITRGDFPGPFGDAPLPMVMPDAGMVPLISRLDVTGAIYDDMMSSMDRQLILRALDASGGKIREAARRLGLARNTLKSKIQKYKIGVVSS